MLKRGFKTWCETTALAYRKEMGLQKHSPLHASTLANHLGVRLIKPEEIPGLDREYLHVLLRSEKDSWSAVTLCRNSSNIVIYNTSRPASRQSNDIMHELSHIIIGHKAQLVHSFDAGLFLRHYDRSQEEEADCLAATLLLSRDALIRIAFSGRQLDAAAKEYAVSVALLSMRMNLSGAAKIAASSSMARPR
jgi:Zn-dependent peptidase ImmA (M78 family)